MASRALAPLLLAIPLAAGGAPPRLEQGELDVCRSLVVHGGATIELLQGRRVAEGPDAGPPACAAWVTVRAGERAGTTRTFPEIAAAGGDFGVAILDGAIGRYRAILKKGDLDGRLLLVDEGGAVTELPGPAFFVVAGRWLVAEHEADDPQLTVFDLERGVAAPVDDGEELGLDPWSDLAGWVELDGQALWIGRPSTPGRTAAVRLDAGRARLERADVASAELARAASVAWVGKVSWRDCRCALSGPALERPAVTPP